MARSANNISTLLQTLQEAAGTTLVFNDSRLTKLNAIGDTLWATNVPPILPLALNRQWEGAAIAQDRQGNYVALGNSSYFTGFGTRTFNTHLARFRPTGQLVNDTAFYYPVSEVRGASLHLAANGGLVISGESYPSTATNGGSDLFMLQFRGFRPLTNRAAEAAAAGFAAYPNPAAGAEAVRLTLPERPGPLALAVFDGLGRAVRHVALPAAAREAALPVAGLPPGLYLLRLSAADGQTWATKLLRE